MRRTIALVLFLVVATLAVAAGASQIRSSGGTLASLGGIGCGTRTVVPAADLGMNYPPDSASSLAATATAGQLTCYKFVQTCTGFSPTKIGANITTQLAGASFSVGIYSSTGASRLLNSGILSAASAGFVSATGLTAAPLAAGTTYLACFATSATATVAARSIVGPITTDGSVNAFSNTWVGTGGTGATAVAQYAVNCVGAANPYACCTGAGVGATCAGLPATVTVTAAAVNLPIIALGS